MSTPPPAPETFARQLRLFKALAALLFLLLVGGVAGAFFSARQRQPVAIVVDGKTLAVVRSLGDADRLLAEAEKAKTGGAYSPDDIVALQAIQRRRVPSDTPLDTAAAARAKLAAALKLHVRAFVIFVGGKPSVGLPSEREASETLRQVKEHGVGLAPDGPLAALPTFVQKVDVRRLSVDPSRLRPSAARAAPYFWTPPPARTAVVRPGDTGFALAVRHKMTFADFLLANPGRNLDKLQPGDLVNVQKMPLLLSVRVQKRRTREEPVIRRAPNGLGGRQRITEIVTYVNGQTVGVSQPVSMEILERPRTRTQL